MFDASHISDFAVCHLPQIHRPWLGHTLRPAAVTPAIETWRQHHSEGAAALTRMPRGAPFELSSLHQIKDMLAPWARTPVALIYITADHQPDYRSPVLPHLLGSLPDFCNVFSLRESLDAIPAIAWEVIKSLLHGGTACLLVHDLSQRLIPDTAENQDAGELRFQLFTPVPHEGADK